MKQLSSARLPSKYLILICLGWLILLACSAPVQNQELVTRIPPHPDAPYMDRDVRAAEVHPLSFADPFVPGQLSRADALSDLDQFGWLLEQAWAGYDYHRNVWGIDFPARIRQARSEIKSYPDPLGISDYFPLVAKVLAGTHDGHLSLQSYAWLRPLDHLDFLASPVLVKKDAKGWVTANSPWPELPIGARYLGSPDHLFRVWAPESEGEL